MKIIAVGKIKKRYIQEGILFYQKQISKLEIIEIKQSTKEQEGKMILNYVKPNDYIIGLDIKGSQYTSEEFASKIHDYQIESKNIIFIIGGSTGLSEEVLKRCNEKISFSKLTFPHELFRLMLIEQIFRAEAINSSKPYHK